jgi:hypothetical protein
MQLLVAETVLDFEKRSDYSVKVTISINIISSESDYSAIRELLPHAHGKPLTANAKFRIEFQDKMYNFWIPM